MKVLVIGSIPPPTGGHRDALLREVLRHRAAGDTVEIVSLDHLAASHRYLVAPGVPAVCEVALLIRRAEAVIIQLEPGMPVRRAAGRAERTAALIGLATALKGRAVTLRLHHLDDLPGGPGGRAAMELWKAAAVIEVGNEAAQAELAAALGPLSDRLVLVSGDSVVALATAAVGAAVGTPAAVGTAVGAAVRTPAASPDDWGHGADATAAHVMGVVRRRAADERSDLGRRGRLPMPGGGTGTRVPQWQWLSAPGAGVPDLGPVKLAAETGNGVLMPLRRSARAVLSAGERNRATRPVAHLARVAWLGLRQRLR